MKRINITLFALMLLAILFSCTRANLNYTQNGNWVGRSTFPSSVAIGFGAGFVIGKSAYIGTGINPLTPNSKLTAMFKYTAATIQATPYGYDSAYGSWTNAASFPGQPRSNAIGFTIGDGITGTGYMGTGLANDGFTALSDFYSYDAPSNTWTAIDSIPIGNNYISGRYDAAAFGFQNSGYVMTGKTQYYYMQDVWKYDPTTGHWTLQPYFNGSQRSGASTFIYKNKGYLMAGYTPGSHTASGNYPYDFWIFDPTETDSTKEWKRLRDIFNTSSGTYDDGYTNIIRTNAVTFEILGQPNGDKGYLTLGSTNGSDVTFTWEYDFVTDLWTEKTPFEGTARTGAVGFTIVTNGVSGSTSTGTLGTTRGFVTTGLNQGSTAAFSDCLEFFPNQVYNQFD
jgi:hypothetical protein